MFSTIRRHQSWLWPCLAVVTIVTMLGFLSPTSRSSGGILGFFKGNHSAYGTIGGQPITGEQYNNAYRDVIFPMAMRRMQLPDSEQADVKREIYIELFLAAKEDQLGIHPTADAVARMALNLLHGAISYDDFVDKNLKPAGLTADDFDRYLRREAGKQQLQALAGLNGRLVIPAEAEALYRAENRAVATKFVWFPASNFLHAVTVAPGAVAQFYTNQLVDYRIHDQVQVNYVRFDASNYFAATKAAMTNLDQQVEDVYARNGTNMFPQAKTTDEVKALIRKELLRISSLKAARRDAFGFADELDKRGNHADDLEKLAKEKELTVYTTAPFDEETGPTELGLTNDLATAFAKDAFRLTSDMPFNHEFITDDAAYVMGLKKTIPTTIPAFKDIEAKVTADYRDARAYELAAQAATNFTTAVAGELNVNNGVTLPKTFTDICNETGNKAVTVPPFSLSATNLPAELEGRVDLQTLKRAGFGTTVGSASPPVNVQGGTFVLFVEKMLPEVESKVKAGTAEYLEMLRRQRQNDAYQLWVNYQIQQDPDLLERLKKLTEQARETSSASSRSAQ